MDLNLVLFIYLITFLALYIVLKKNRYTSFSAFILAVVVAELVLVIIYPPTNDNLTTNVDSATSLYFFLIVAGIVLLVVYAISTALGDYRDDPNIARDKLFVPRVYYN